MHLSVTFVCVTLNYMCICNCGSVHIHTYIKPCTQSHIHIYTYIYIHTYIYIYVHTNIYIHIYTCIYAFVLSTMPHLYVSFYAGLYQTPWRFVSHASCDGVSANIRKRALYIAKEPYISAKSPIYIIFAFHMRHAIVCPQISAKEPYISQKSPIYPQRALYIYNFRVSHASCDGLSANIRKRALYIAKEPYISAKSPIYIIFSFHMRHAMVCPQISAKEPYISQKSPIYPQRALNI